jgi:hypothetical protein
MKGRVRPHGGDDAKGRSRRENIKGCDIGCALTVCSLGNRGDEARAKNAPSERRNQASPTICACRRAVQRCLPNTMIHGRSSMFFAQD